MEGVAVDEALNESYWAMKNGGEFQVWAGFKLFLNEDDAYAVSEGVSMMYTLQDLGFEDPNPPVQEEAAEESADMSDSGASALATAAATALAAFLLM